MRGKVTIVACPKLDPVNYLKKLTEVIRENDIKSVTIVLQSECESSNIDSRISVYQIAIP